MTTASSAVELSRPCARCGQSTPASYRVCRECIAGIARETCARQGVELEISDPVRAERLARMVRTPVATPAPAAEVA